MSAPVTTHNPDDEGALSCDAGGTAPARNEWQSIETAPQNGTTILVWCPTMYSGKIKFANWDRDTYSSRPRPYWRMSDQRIDGTPMQRKNQPTHWRPLPDPPEVA